MQVPVSIEQFIEKAKAVPVLDVRSPGEFLQGHITGACNIPLFTDEERRDVGIKYKQEGRDPAIILGLDIVGKKMTSYIHQAKSIAFRNEILVHCWRGGMRSSSMAWLLDMAGIRTYCLIKGYKAFRKFVHNSFTENGSIIILGGMTGSGKTEILSHLAEDGQQVLDLENRAHHKGSAFGSLGQTPQPTTEQFENDVFHDWNNLDFSKRIWIEDESRAIGSVQIPEGLYTRMRKSTVINIIVPKEHRIKRLVRDYSNFDSSLLELSIRKIANRLGGQHAKAALIALERDDFSTVADITLTYYDKAYNYGLFGKREKTIIHDLVLEKDDPADNAVRVAEFAMTL